MKKELETKVNEIVAKFPEMREICEKYTGGNGVDYIQDIKYLESETCQIVAIKSERHTREGFSRFEWRGSASAYLKRKDETKIGWVEYTEQPTDSFVIRDIDDPKYDDSSLQAFDKIYLEKVPENHTKDTPERSKGSVFDFAWMNEHGRRYFGERIMLYKH